MAAKRISIFPLSGVIMLPGMQLPLHIFEPRYRSLVSDALARDRMIGMIQPRQTPNGEKRLQAIGCAGRLTGFSETEDGRYMITLSGVSRFRVKEEVEGFAPYRRCLVDWAPFSRDLGNAEEDAKFERKVFLDVLGRFFDKQGLSTDWKGLKEAEPER